MDKYFFCYNKKVSDYLTTKDIKPITIAKEMRDNRIFSLYKQSHELNKALQEYKLNK